MSEVKEEKAVEETVEEVKEEKKTSKGVIVAVFPTGEKVEYSKEVHGEDFRSIAEATCEKFGGSIEE